MAQTLSIPARMRIDNAANIYPASLSKHYASLYRMSVTLTEPVDPAVLQTALVTVADRLPTFRCELRAGAFWWHLRRMEKEPVVSPSAPLNRFHFSDNGGFLYKVSADGGRIVLDVFHALADGTGAETFLVTLAGEYLRLKYGLSISYGGHVLDPSDAPDAGEVEDSFKAVFSGRRGELEKGVPAYHLTGRKLPEAGLRDIRAILPMEPVKAVCRRLDCTVTELLTGLMLDALQKVYRGDGNTRKSSVIKVSVPVNLRPLYGSRSVRNFSSYVNLGVDVRSGYLQLEPLVRLAKMQKRAMLRPENLEPKIAANVELEENFAVRCLPLSVKKPVIDLINRRHGDAYCSQTLSNLGEIRLPEEMRPYVKAFDFVLGRQRGNSGAVSCAGYDGKLFVHLSRNIEEADFEQLFLGRAAALGIPAEVTHHILA
ncbi:MAG: hypothetical protein IJ156_04905 [Bacteroidales bacterium]|nr:hypothetical protein [Bacteroidales bacterium]